MVVCSLFQLDCLDIIRLVRNNALLFESCFYFQVLSMVKRREYFLHKIHLYFLCDLKFIVLKYLLT